MPATFNMSDVMISYSRKDREFVQRLDKALRDSGREVWIDWEDIPPTADWLAEIKAGIEAAHTFVFVITPNAVRSEVCRLEVDHAVTCNKRLVPILREEVTNPADQKLVHPDLNRHNWIMLRESDNFNTGFQALIRALESDLSHVQAHTRLLVRAHEWEGNDCPNSLLLRGDDLRAAENWLASGINKDPVPTELQAEYIKASRRAATRNRQLVAALSTAAMVALLLLAVFGLNQAAQANRALAQVTSEIGTKVAVQGQVVNSLATATSAGSTAVAANASAQAALSQANLAATEAAVQKGEAQSNLLTATNAEGQAVAIGLTATNAQGQVQDIALTATYAQGQAEDNLLTATAAQGQGEIALLTAQAAQTDAVEQQGTANAVATLAAKNQSAADQAKSQAAAAQTQAAQQQQLAQQAQLAAANAQASAVAAQQTAAAAQTNAANALATANAAGTQASDALTRAAKANNDANQAKQTATAALQTAWAAQTVAASAQAEATKALLTATAVSNEALSLRLAADARIELSKNNRDKAAKLALLANSFLATPPAQSQDTLYDVGTSLGVRKTMLFKDIIPSGLKWSGKIAALTLSGSRLFAADSTGNIFVWELTGAGPAAKLLVSSNVSQNKSILASFSPDGSKVLVCDLIALMTIPNNGCNLTLWDISNASIVAATRQPAQITSDNNTQITDIIYFNNGDDTDPTSQYAYIYYDKDDKSISFQRVSLSTKFGPWALQTSSNVFSRLSILNYATSSPVRGQFNIYSYSVSGDNLDPITTYYIGSGFYSYAGYNSKNYPLGADYIEISPPSSDPSRNGGSALAVVAKSILYYPFDFVYDEEKNINVYIFLSPIAFNTPLSPTIITYNGIYPSDTGQKAAVIGGEQDGNAGVSILDLPPLDTSYQPRLTNPVPKNNVQGAITWVCKNMYWRDANIDSYLSDLEPEVQAQLKASLPNETDCKANPIPTAKPPLAADEQLAQAIPMTGTPPTTPTLDPYAQQVVESDDARVARTDNWQRVAFGDASGGAYLISTQPQDTLTLPFEGTGVLVTYLQNPVAQGFAVSVDGVALGTIASTSSAVGFRQAVVSGLPMGSHTLQVTALQYPIVIDSFVVNPHLESLATLAPLATSTLEIVTPTETPTPSITPSATATPAETDTVEASPQASATVEVTPVVTSETTAEATPTVTPSLTETPSETPTLTASPTETATPAPSLTPTDLPTVTPSLTATDLPTAAPLAVTDAPTLTPTEEQPQTAEAGSG